jgi:hypothetical protein
VAQPGYVAGASALRADRVNGLIAYDLGVRDDPSVLAVYPIRETVAAGALDARFRTLVAARRSIFAEDWPWRLGQPLGAWATRDAKACSGVVDVHVALGSSSGALVRFEGWSVAARGGRPADLIVVTDSQDRVVGLGEPGYPRPDVAAARHSRAAQFSGFRATARGDDAAAMRVYGLEFGGRPRACELAGAVRPPG